ALEAMSAAPWSSQSLLRRRRERAGLTRGRTDGLRLQAPIDLFLSKLAKPTVRLAERLAAEEAWMDRVRRLQDVCGTQDGRLLPVSLLLSLFAPQKEDRITFLGYDLDHLVGEALPPLPPVR